MTNTLTDGNTTVSVEQRTCDDRQSASPTVITLTSTGKFKTNKKLHVHNLFTINVAEHDILRARGHKFASS